ncbi:Rieske 2Fe-2S domain-containing protein [bacterium]|nr:Rieske 2Fe-2S domain-containing protein [bacterium]
MNQQTGGIDVGVFDHWHPVVASSKLRQKPIGIMLGGKEFVLFRGAGGKIGAMEDCCVHRRARLSRGSVINGKLQCSYHGWQYDTTGQAESPGTPKLRVCAHAFDTAEKHGYVWMKRAGAQAVIPEFDLAGYEYVCARDYMVPAPLEVVLDNFTEVEHTPTTHANFGYDLSKMAEVRTTVEQSTDTVRVINTGPQKKTPWVVQQLAGLKTGDIFTDDWVTYFSPVYTQYEQFWNDPKTGAERRDRYRIYVFFNPIDQDRTELVVFAYLRARTAARAAFIKLTRPLLSLIVHIEIVCDVKMLSSLADKSPELHGMKLSRFDRVLGLNRDRIQSIYRGESPTSSVSVPTIQA